MPFDLASFRARYPDFDAVADATVEAVAVEAEILIPEGTCADQKGGVNMLVAHMLFLEQNGSSGRAVSSSSVGDVSVSYEALPSSDLGKYLSLSSYGNTLWLIMRQCSLGGRYHGGMPETKAFRRAGGRRI